MDGEEEMEAPPNQTFISSTLEFTRCDWLLCLLKIQRQMLALTMELGDHSKCAQIIHRLGGRFGVFSCCHGHKFICDPEPANDVQPSGNNVNNEQSNSSKGSSSHEFLSNIDGIEDYLETIKRSFRCNSCLPFVSESDYQECTDKNAIAQFADGKGSLVQTPSLSRFINPSVPVKETFDCPICMEELPKKHAFACGDFKHTICLECTKSLTLRWYSSGDSSIHCPLCRRSFPMDMYIKGFQIGNTKTLRNSNASSS